MSSSAGGEEIYHNRGGGDLVPAGALLGLRRESAGRGLSWGDYDGDGRQDLLIAGVQRTVLYRNRVEAAPWLRVELQGQDGNFNALGARVELSADGRQQVRELQSIYGYSSQVQTVAAFWVGSSRAGGLAQGVLARRTAERSDPYQCQPAAGTGASGGGV